MKKRESTEHWTRPCRWLRMRLKQNMRRIESAPSLVKERARGSLSMTWLAALLIVSAPSPSFGMTAEGPLSIPQQYSVYEARLSPLKVAERVAEHTLVQGILPVGYVHDTQLVALLALYDVTGNEKYLRFVQNNVRSREGRDRLNFVVSIGFELFKRTHDRQDMGPFESQAREDRKGLRAFDGAISFYDDQFAVVKQEDGDIFLTREMAPIFIDHLAEFASRMAKTGWLSGEDDFYREAAQQIFIYRSALRDPKTGLWAHGRGWYGSSHDLAATKWGRAHAWLMRALVDTLSYLPPNSPEFRQVSAILHDLARVLIRYQDREGFWHQVVDHPESYQETSATGLISYYFALAIHKGYLPKNPFQRASKRAFEALTKNRISFSGEVYGGSKATPPQMSLERYIARPTPIQDPHAVAAAILSASGQLLLEGKGRIAPASPQAH